MRQENTELPFKVNWRSFPSETISFQGKNSTQIWFLLLWMSRCLQLVNHMAHYFSFTEATFVYLFSFFFMGIYRTKGDSSKECIVRISFYFDIWNLPYVRAYNTINYILYLISLGSIHKTLLPQGITIFFPMLDTNLEIGHVRLVMVLCLYPKDQNCVELN